ncbi:hypothetical protein [Anaeromyxobacter sp. SG17]|uniref:hypothetical protein n=1 Tax=Anaeromyxobacter sp. SG17 TaxID=2925405 RepID=UPI001F591ADF|nr:hypothetical protein [Anaeromyxobacter sp. SG17]
MPARLCRDTDADTYRTLFDIEAYLRLLARWELRGHAGRSWAGTLSATVRSDAESRRAQELADGIIDPLESGLLSYVHLSDLKDVLVGPLWAKCSRHWRASLDIVKSEFKKLIAVRNKVAHFRPVTDWDAKVVVRFAEDLTRWTRPYRKLREFEVSWSAPGDVTEEVLGLLRKHSLEPVAAELAGVAVPPGDQLSAAVVGHHVALRLKRSAGALSSQRVTALLSRNERDVTIARVGEFGGSLEVLTPAACGSDAIVALARDIVSSADEVVEGVSSEELVSAFGLDRHEGVLTSAVTFPDPYEYAEG